MDKIYIYGAPASGKTTLGKKMAKALGEKFIDLDEMIIAKEGRFIDKIFADDGEGYFRKLESSVLEEIAIRSDAKVVALGGGTLLDKANRMLCEKTGRIFVLDVPEKDILRKRIENDTTKRPLGEKSVERLLHYASFENRLHSYFEVANSLVLVGTKIKDSFLNGNIVVDATVKKLYPLIKNALSVVPSGEEHKNANTISSLYKAFSEAGIDRHSVVTAIGGGVTLDLVGFAAATWMRGISWINIPTTLLSMVDASIGGKTGYDLECGKNLVGAFHPPKLVVIDTEFLSTLSPALLAQGRAEMIKHEILGAKKMDIALNRMPSALEISGNIKIKADIVNEDFKETLNKRLLLNLGHTVGHAIEKLSSYTISHGDAVAIGCVEEARIAVRKSLASKDWVNELISRFREAGLNTSLPKDFTIEKLKMAMRSDKKHNGNIVRFALPCGWGDVKSLDIDISKEGDL